MALEQYAVVFRGVRFSRISSKRLAYVILDLDGEELKPHAWVCTLEGVAYQQAEALREGRTIAAVPVTKVEEGARE